MYNKQKICSTCKKEIPLSSFHKYGNSPDGHTHRCKECVSRKKEVPIDTKICTTCKKIKILDEFNDRKNGKFGKSSICKICINKKLKIYREKNNQKINEIRKLWRNNKRKNDVIFKLICNVRCRLYGFLKMRKMKKNNTTFNIVGCTPLFLKKYLENQFTDGMSWDNYGFYGWHIDHKIPLYSGNNEDEIYKLCYYTNLQPLWGDENFKKGKNLIHQ